MTQKCKACGVAGTCAEFYSGMNSRCKECHKSKVRENRAKKVNYYRAYDAKRFKNDPRVKERHKRYQATPAGRASNDKAKKKWCAGNKEKRAAHVILGNRVRDGKITKPDMCECCGEKASRIHGHHEDYAQPLNVVWCCSKCHRAVHEGNIEVTIINGKFAPEDRA